MHMPKKNLFAYICATVLGVCVMIVGFRGALSETLANGLLIFFGAMMVGSGIVTIRRHLKNARENRDK